MVSDVIVALRELKAYRFDSGYDTEEYAVDHVLGVAEFNAQKLLELADLWQIYCGRRLNATAVIPSTPLQLHVSARIYELGNHKQPNPPGTTSSDRALLAWRFVCSSRNKDRRVSLWKSGKRVPMVACFGAKTPKMKQLMDQFGHVQRHGYRGTISDHFTLRGTSKDKALCLERIVEEVWADADGQLDDGWQQPYMLACPKRYFSALWNMPKGNDSEPEGDYKYEP